MAKTTEVAAQPAAGAGSTTDGERYTTSRETGIIGAGMVFLGLLLAWLLASVWPSKVAIDAAGNGGKLTIEMLFWPAVTFQATADVQLLLVVMLAGALGSFIHAATSFSDFVGNQKLMRSWAWWYILRPFIGAALALILYTVVRGGFLSTSIETDKLNIYGVAALAGLAGMFTKQATDKLSEVFNTMFRTEKGAGDAARKDDLKNQVPTLSDIDPKAIEPRTQNLVVEAKGTSFVMGSVVLVNDKRRDTTFKSDTLLVATLLADDVAAEGKLDIKVFNPPPGGGESQPLQIRVAVNSGVAPSTAAENDADGCDVEITLAMPDEALPPARGGVARS